MVDTPGFGDSDQEDSVLIDEMMGVLKETVKSATVLYLVLDGSADRFSDNLQQMLREMRALFGDNMWDNMLVGVNKWPFSQEAIDDRTETCTLTPKYCRDEATFSASMMGAIEEKFHVGRNLTFAFVDSWAKHPKNLDDEVQQEAFARETKILWDFAMTAKEFEFKSIEDVLKESDELKEENQYLNDIIANNITEILKILAEQAAGLSNLEISHKSDIAMLNENLVEGLSNLEISHNSDIAKLNETLSHFENLPLGTIIAWNHLDKIHPDNWVECDGRKIDSEHINFHTNFC